MKNRAVRFLVMAVVFSSLWLANSGICHAEAMPSYAWLRAIAAASPVAVALDRDDNIYVADAVNNVVTSYSSTGAVLGKITALAKPISVAVDGNGRVYVGNDKTDNVMVFGPDLHFLFSLGSGDGEVGKPTGITVDDFGVVYVVDNAADLVKVYSSAGVLQYSFGGTGSTSGLFHSPMGIAVNEVKQEVVVVDRPVVDTGEGFSESGRAQIFDMGGKFKSSFGEPSGSYLTYLNDAGAMQDQGMLAKPTSIAADTLGRLYITDTNNNIVQVYDDGGHHLGFMQDEVHRLRTPMDLVVSRVTGRLYVASLSGGVVDVFGAGESYTVTAGAGTGGTIAPDGELSAAAGEKISFSVTPATGYRLVSVSLDGVPQDDLSQVFDLIVISDHIVAAEFALATFSFVALANENGCVTFSRSEPVPYGGEQVVTVTPPSGYLLADLLVDGGSVWDKVVANTYTFVNVTSDHTVQAVYEPDPAVGFKILKADNYLDGDAATYPLLADGGEVVFEVVGGSGLLRWSVFDANGVLISGIAGTGNTFTVSVDELFAYGAGVYTVQVVDEQGSVATVKVRVPMRIAPMFANHEDTDGSVAFSVTGAEGAFTWSVLDENGQVLAAPLFGTLGSSTAATNTLTLEPGIAAVTSFQVRAQIADPVLAAAELDTVIAGPQVVMPMRQLAVRVNDGSSLLNGVVVSAMHDQSCAAVTGADGTAVLPALAATGATYAFAVQKEGYLPVIVSTNDLGAQLTVSLDAIASPAVISGAVSPVGRATRVMLLRADNTPVADSRGLQVQVLADAVSGAFALSFDSIVAGSGPYRVAAIRPGFIYNLVENEGVVDAVAGETGKVIPLHQVTKLAVVDDGASPDVTFSITASPVFDGTGGEVQAFAGTSAAASEVTTSLVSAGGGVYTYRVLSPALGEVKNIFVRADTSAARSAASGYFATFGVAYMSGLNAPEESIIGSPHRGGVATTTTASGHSSVAVPAGGVSGDVLAAATLVMTEADPQLAGLDDLISCSEIVNLALYNTASGEGIADGDIDQLYVTMQFDPGKILSGDFESGVAEIWHAADIAGLRSGTATMVPVTQIIKPINYGAGKVTFRVDSPGAFGIGCK